MDNDRRSTPLDPCTTSTAVRRGWQAKTGAHHASRTLSVYVAASSAPDQMDRARAVSDRLRKLGVHITSTWIENIDAVGTANQRTASRSQRAAWSDSCLDGVELADVIMFLVPPRSAPTCGAWVEVGYAIARDKHVVASGDTTISIFLGMEQVSEASDDDDAVALISRLPVGGVR